jgi:opacity protein-like surface antigen
MQKQINVGTHCWSRFGQGNRFIAAAALACGIMAPAVHAAEYATFADRLSFVGEFGANFMPAVGIQNIAPGTGTAIGIGGAEADVNVGLAANFAFRIDLIEEVALEIQGGYIQNNYGGMKSGYWTDGTTTSPIIGGDGNFAQIPIFVNGIFKLPLANRKTGAGSFNLEIGGGIGVVDVMANVNGISAADPILGGNTVSVDGSSWELGGQFNIGVMWGVTANFDVGVRYRMIAVGGANFGPAEFSDGTFGSADIESDSIIEHAVVGSLIFRF